MSDLGANKIFGAVLATGLVILGLGATTDILFEVEPPEKPGYAVEVQEAAAEGAAAPEVPPDWGTVLATADVAAGQTVSTKCASCHVFVAGGPAMTGPDLYGVIGRKPGSAPGFAYSASMHDFAGKAPVWDYQHVYDFLAAPQRYINGTKMTFVGLKKRDERINLIAWLRQQSASPAPIPAPNPAAAAAAETPTAAPGGTPGGEVTATAPAGPTAAPAGAPANAASASQTGQTAAAAPAAAKDAPGRVPQPAKP